MDQSGSESKPPVVITDFDGAFRLYENVIASQDEALKVQATIKLARLSNRTPENILTRTVPILVDLFQSPVINLSPSVQEASAYCLKCIACEGDGRLALVIGESGAIPSLLSLLPCSEVSLQRVLLKCLRNIVTFGNPNRMIVVRNGGLEIILDMLNSCPDSLRRFLLEILSALALLKEVRRVIVSLGGISFLVESARRGSMISRTRAAQAIGLLGLVRRARRTLVDSGAIQALLALLQDGDNPTKLVAGNALGVISSHVDYIRPVAEAGSIPLYAELLEGSDPIGKEIAEDVFCILAVFEEHAITITEHLVKILRGGDDEAKAAAADVLWNLSGYKNLPGVVRNSGVIPILVELLRDEDYGVREKVSGAVAQLSYNEADRIALADSGAIPHVIDMLEDESDELRDNAAETLVNFSADPVLRERISGVLDNPSFHNMQARLIQIRASDDHLEMTLRHMTVEQLPWDPVLV